MVDIVTSVTDQWNATVMNYAPSIIGALIVLLIGWIVGPLLGRAVLSWDSSLRIISLISWHGTMHSRTSSS